MITRIRVTNEFVSVVQPDGTDSYFALVLRLVAGYWFLHAGLAKLLAAEPFSAAGWLTGAAGGTVVGPVTVWFGNNAAWCVDLAIPLGEALIGPGLLVGALTRLAAFFGAFLMGFFYLGNAGYAHGFVNGDLLGAAGVPRDRRAGRRPGLQMSKASASGLDPEGEADMKLHFHRTW